MGNCVHHWVFDMPNGPTSRGVCKHCNEIKIAVNSMRPFSFVERLNGKEFDALREKLKANVIARQRWGT